MSDITAFEPTSEKMPARVNGARKLNRPATTDTRRLDNIARALETPNWCGGTHSIETTDHGTFGVGTRVYFDAAKRARPRDCVVLLHRTRRQAIECRLVEEYGDGWVVYRFSRRFRFFKISRLSKRVWCGGYRVVASLIPRRLEAVQ
jgi:hypothetical protein